MSALAIVLAAGKSTRMKSALPKILHETCGRPLIDYVLDAARAAGASRIVTVVGHQADRVQGYLSRYKDVEFALQAEQKGTGHAVMMCRDALAAHTGPVLILAGDMPLVRAESLARLLAVQTEQRAAAVIGSAMTPANQGLGRIVRNTAGAFQRIVEEKDATPEQKQIQEVNTGCYAFDAALLLAALDQIRPNNVQSEYYLTDCPRVLLEAGHPVAAEACFTIAEALGVNTRSQLAEVTRSIQHTTQERWMTNGVSIICPEQTYIDPRATIGPETVIEPFTVIRGPAVIGSSCRIGPHAVVNGPFTLLDGSIVKPFTTVGG